MCCTGEDTRPEDSDIRSGLIKKRRLSNRKWRSFNRKWIFYWKPMTFVTESWWSFVTENWWLLPTEVFQTMNCRVSRQNNEDLLLKNDDVSTVFESWCVFLHKKDAFLYCIQIGREALPRDAEGAAAVRLNTKSKSFFHRKTTILRLKNEDSSSWKMMGSVQKTATARSRRGSFAFKNDEFWLEMMKFVVKMTDFY